MIHPIQDQVAAYMSSNEKHAKKYLKSDAERNTLFSMHPPSSLIKIFVIFKFPICEPKFSNYPSIYIVHEEPQNSSNYFMLKWRQIYSIYQQFSSSTKWKL